MIGLRFYRGLKYVLRGSCLQRSIWCSTSFSSTAATPFAVPRPPRYVDLVLKHLSGTEDKYMFLAPLDQKKSAAQYVEQILEEQPNVENKQELIALVHSILKSEEVEVVDTILEEKCLQHFQSWIGHAKLGVGFLLYANGNKNLGSEKYSLRIIEHLAQDLSKLTKEELVALMLTIHFRKVRWKEEELYKTLDPVLLQKKLASLICHENADKMDSAEVCAVCLGLKNIDGFSVSFQELRISLYENLYYLGESQKPFSEIDELAIKEVCLLLAKGKHIFRDERHMIEATLGSYVNKISTMSMATAVKLVSFGALIQLKVPALTSNFTIRMEAESDQLVISEVAGLANYFTRTEEHTAKVGFDALLKRTVSETDSGLVTVIDASYYLQALSSLISVRRMDMSVLIAIFREVNNLDCDTLNVREKASSAILKVIFETVFPKSRANITEEKFQRHLEFVINQDPLKVSRAIVNLNANAIIEFPDFPKDNLLNPEHFERLVKLTRVPVPIEAHSPAMALDNLPFRQRNLVSVQRALNRYFGSDIYARNVYILPHFSEADLVFGCLNSVALSLPQELLGDEVKLKKAPPFGDFYVVSVKASETHRVKVSSLGSNELLKRRQLAKLGFKIFDVNIRDVVTSESINLPFHHMGGARNPTRLENKLDKLLSGFQGEDPYERENWFFNKGKQPNNK